MEIWKEIKDYPLYQVSNLGRVKSLRFGKERIIKGGIDTRGYSMMNLTGNNCRESVLTHRLVAKAFIPNLENKPNVNHINGIKTDNRVENLEWCTQRENVIHAFENGLCSDKKGVNNGRAIVTEHQVLEIRKISGKSTAQIARDYGLTWDCVCKIRKRKTWVHI